MVSWDLQLGARGELAECRHDRAPFADARRLSRHEADTTRLFLPVCEIRGDWPALADMACVRTWSHKLHSCLCCKVPKALMSSISGYSLQSGPFDRVTSDDIADEIAAHKIVGRDAMLF